MNSTAASRNDSANIPSDSFAFRLPDDLSNEFNEFPRNDTMTPVPNKNAIKITHIWTRLKLPGKPIVDDGLT